jgi:hypothetical protein
MSTRVPSWAYVLGRYLTGLLISLGLAVLMLGAILGMGFLLHLTIADYPAPVIGNALAIWGSMIVPATVLVASLSFALGTLLPQQANLVKIVVLIGWFIGVVVLPASLDSLPSNASPPSWYINWDPTSAATARGMLRGYETAFQNNPASRSQFQHVLLTLENSLPNISAWLAPHLILAGVSLLLVAAAALTFQRFRGALGGAS